MTPLIPLKMNLKKQTLKIEDILKPIVKPDFFKRCHLHKSYLVMVTSTKFLGHFSELEIDNETFASALIVFSLKNGKVKTPQFIGKTNDFSANQHFLIHKNRVYLLHFNAKSILHFLNIPTHYILYYGSRLFDADITVIAG